MHWWSLGGLSESVCLISSFSFDDALGLPSPSWLPAWVLIRSWFIGGLESNVIGSIRWCVWSFRLLAALLRLPHLEVLFVVFCLFLSERWLSRSRHYCS